LTRRILLTAFALLVSLASAPAQAAARWTPQQANDWYAKQPWLVGCNYAPRTAINQLEMWQAHTFDPKTIDQELGWAESLGFTSVRVFLHDLLWKQDSRGFSRRIERFLEIAEKHKIGVMFVLLDSVWDPYPRLGKQHEPTPHLHNSGWVQSPGAEILRDPKRHDELKPYIQGVLRRFGKDSRVQVWDLWNEPDNPNTNSYGPHEPPHKGPLIQPLLKKVFEWAQEANPDQPLTSAIWIGDWSTHEKLQGWEKVMVEESDIITFHNYGRPDDLRRRIGHLKRYNRPIVCTEYMARPNGSTFEGVLPVLKEERVGAYNWGFVSGKSQTIYPWDTWTKKYFAEPPVWFHDIFRGDGSAYIEAEVRLIRLLTGKLAVRRRPILREDKAIAR
jgi:hypothetical protein